LKRAQEILRKGYAKRILLIFAILVVVFFIVNDLLMPWYVHRRDEISVPSVVGKTSDEAKEILSAAGLDPREGDVLTDPKYPVGTVISQNPPPEKIVRQGRRVYLTLSGGERHVIVPNLNGQSLNNAKFMLEQVGLKIGATEYEGSDVYFENTIIRQTIAPRISVKQGTRVGVVVSQGRVSEKMPAPDLLNKSLTEAENILKSLGLSVGKITYQSVPDVLPNTVVSQIPRPGEMVPNGGSIDLFISQQAGDQKDQEEN